MILSDSGLKNREPWVEAGFELPEYDREKVRENTLKNPTWLHFGAGNIFRGFPAALQQKLLNDGKTDKGIIVCEGYDYEIIEKAYKPYDNLSVLVVLKPDGNMQKKVIASVVEALTTEQSNWQRLKNIFANPSLQMVSFTITEKGYSLKNAKGVLRRCSKRFRKRTEYPKSFIGKLASLCYERYRSGKYPLALVSMDNCSHNGTKLYEAVSAFAGEWVKNGLVEKVLQTI